MKILIILSILFSSNAFSHARLRADGITPPRNNNAGLKTGPCGGVARTNSSVTLTAGSTITLTWEEVVQHPGSYEFSISLANDQNFVRLKVVPDTQDNGNDLPHQYSTTLDIPNVVCDACTLQMIQVMTENPNNPRNYYSCADIKIVAGNTPPEDEMPAPVPPTPCLHQLQLQCRHLLLFQLQDHYLPQHLLHLRPQRLIILVTISLTNNLKC